MKISGITNSAYQVVSVIGLAIGGFIVGFVGEMNAIFLDAVSFLISALVIMTLEYKYIENNNKSDIIKVTGNILTDIKSGLNKIFSNKKNIIYLKMLISISIIIAPVEPYVTEAMNQFGYSQYSDIGIGIMFSILSLGVIGGNFGILLLKDKISDIKKLVLLLISSIIGIFVMSQQNIILLGMGIFIIGLSSGASRTLSVCTIITSVEQNFRARVSSIIILVVLSITPLATILVSYFIEICKVNYIWILEVLIQIGILFSILKNRSFINEIKDKK